MAWPFFFKAGRDAFPDSRSIEKTLSDEKCNELKELRKLSDLARDGLRKATDPAVVQQRSDEYKKIVSDAWQVVDGGMSKILADRAKKHQGKQANNKGLTQLLKAAMQKHKEGMRLDSELQEEDQALAAAAGVADDGDSHEDRAQLIETNLDILHECVAGSILKFTVVTKAGEKTVAGTYKSHSPEILKLVPMTSKSGKEVSWRVEIIQSLEVVGSAGQSSAPASTSDSHISLPSVRRNLDAGLQSAGAVLSAKDGAMAAVAKRRKLDVITAVGKMASEELHSFADGRTVKINDVDWSYTDAVENNDAYVTYSDNGRSDDIFNAWYDRANELLDGECEPPFRAGLTIQLSSGFRLGCILNVFVARSPLAFVYRRQWRGHRCQHWSRLVSLK